MLLQVFTRCNFMRAAHFTNYILLLGAIWLSSGLHAQETSRLDFDQGVQAAEAGNYAEAFCIWKPLAEVGHAQAQYRLGWLYAKGLGLTVNVATAMRWWQSAAELGHADAQFSLGWAYHHGEGIERDMSRALDYYLEASRHGHVDATEILQELLMHDDKRVIEGLSQLLSEQPDAMGKAASIKVGRANIRSGPNKNERLLVTLKQGDALRVMGNNGNWLRVWLVKQQHFGWVFNRLVEQY